MRILALTKYGEMAASTRQRFLQYVKPLSAHGIDLTISPLLDDRHMEALVRGRRSSPLYVAGRYMRRTSALLSAGRYDLLWIHCDLFPYLPGWLETAGVRLARRPVVFDYDDAIFHMYDAHPSPLVRSLLGHKLEPLLRRARGATCGNEYLRRYAAQFCSNAIVVPTVVDTDLYRPTERGEQAKLTIGWIGSPSTWKNVQTILPVLEDVCRAHEARFRAVGAGAASKGDGFEGLELVPWSQSTEILEVQKFDVGIMPLVDAPFERGKSGYKLVQYMACGIPSVGSPIGVNRTILEDGCGLLANSLDEWKQALEQLLSDGALRERMGKKARARAVEAYSLKAHAPRLIEFFKTVA